MAIRSSYVFYRTSFPPTERKEGTLLSRVFITDDKVTLYTKELVKTVKSGVLYEQISAQQTFSLHTNRNGEKYLKRSNKSLTGSITDTSLDAIPSSNWGTTQLVNIVVVNPECLKLIEQTILGWFGYEWKSDKLAQIQVELLFPALRDASFNVTYELPKALIDLQTSTSTITKALRENDSWTSFLADVCRPTVNAKEDLEIIKKNPSSLMPWAMMDLGVTMSALYHKSSDGLYWLVNSFSQLDTQFINFMFKNLSVNSKPEALETLLEISRLHFAIPKRENLNIRSFFKVEFQRVPAKLRPELASVIADKLIETRRIVADVSVTVTDTYVVTDLYKVVREWFAQNVLPFQLETRLRVEDVDKRFQELFNYPLPTTGSLELHTTGEHALFSFHKKHNEAGRTTQTSTDLFTSLSALVVTQRPKTKSMVAGSKQHWMNGYMHDTGVFIPLSSELYSLDGILQLLESGVEETDKQLRKLGRAVTPENRVAFLTLGSKERKFKNTWKYYDWGVTNAAKILALKVANITTKNEVQAYKDLPDEMFYEFLAMASGREIETLTGQVPAKPENLFRSYRNSMGKMTLRKMTRK